MHRRRSRPEVPAGVHEPEPVRRRYVLQRRAAAELVRPEHARARPRPWPMGHPVLAHRRHERQHRVRLVRQLPLLRREPHRRDGLLHVLRLHLRQRLPRRLVVRGGRRCAERRHGESLVRGDALGMFASPVLRTLSHGPRLLSRTGRVRGALRGAGLAGRGLLRAAMREQQRLPARRDVHGTVGCLHGQSVRVRRGLPGQRLGPGLRGRSLRAALRRRRGLSDGEWKAAALRRQSSTRKCAPRKRAKATTTARRRSARSSTATRVRARPSAAPTRIATPEPVIKGASRCRCASRARALASEMGRFARPAGRTRTASQAIASSRRTRKSASAVRRSRTGVARRRPVRPRAAAIRFRSAPALRWWPARAWPATLHRPTSASAR